MLSGAGRYAEAESAFRKAKDDFKRQRGTETDNIARLRRDFGLLLVAMGQDQDAAQQFEIAKTTWTKLDAGHPEALRCAAQLSGIAARAQQPGALDQLREIAEHQRASRQTALADTLVLLAGLSADAAARSLRAEALQLFVAQGRIRLAQALEPGAKLSAAVQTRVQPLAGIAQTILADARAANQTSPYGLSKQSLSL